MVTKEQTGKTIKTIKEKLEEKQMYEYFKWQTGEMAHEKTRTWLRKNKRKFFS